MQCNASWKSYHSSTRSSRTKWNLDYIGMMSKKKSSRLDRMLCLWLARGSFRDSPATGDIIINRQRTSEGLINNAIIPPKDSYEVRVPTSFAVRNMFSASVRRSLLCCKADSPIR